MLHSAKSGGLSRHAAVDTLRCRPRIHVHHADRPRIMTCPAQTLHRAGHCTGTANLKDLVNVSHIDPELHGRCRAKKPEPSFPQFLLHLRPLFLGKTSMMNSGEPVAAQQIDVIGQLFRIPPPFRKCNHTFTVQTLLINRHPQFFPDRILSSPICRSRSHHLNEDLLFHGRSTNHCRLRGQIFRRQFQRLNRGRQTDALKITAAKPVQPGDGEHQVSPPLRIDQCVKLVDNHCLSRFHNTLARP